MDSTVRGHYLIVNCNFTGPPSMPSSRPLITDYGQEAVRLAWKPSPSPVSIKKPLPVSYRVESQELPSTDWLPMASGLSSPSLYLPQLHDDRDYNVRVRAENKYGVSDPSEPLWIPRARSKYWQKVYYLSWKNLLRY